MVRFSSTWLISTVVEKSVATILFPSASERNLEFAQARQIWALKAAHTISWMERDGYEETSVTKVEAKSREYGSLGVSVPKSPKKCTSVVTRESI
ncbi:hypothetical protein M405DRAFT_815201, partial [Rhizopogon salebrosus TDB-379]